MDAEHITITPDFSHPIKIGKRNRKEGYSTKNTNWLECCRLCGKFDDCGIRIFGVEGLRNDLPSKINKYFAPVEVKVGDEFPEVICQRCFQSVISWHELYTIVMAVNENFHNNNKFQMELNSFEKEFDSLEDSDDRESSFEEIDKFSTSNECRNSTESTMNFPTEIKSESEDRPKKRLKKTEKRKWVPAGDKFVCEMCGKKFVDKQGVLLHIEQHLDIKYPCQYCGKLFHKLTLRYHLKKEEGVRKYKCDQCGKSFLVANGLKVHLLKHSQERSIVCHICGKMFKSRDYVRKHVKDVHPDSDRKPYICHLCSASFKNQKNLTQHLKGKRHSNDTTTTATYIGHKVDGWYK